MFLTNDDKVSYTVNKSKSHFGLFKKTVNNAFKNVKERPEVFGMDEFLLDEKMFKRNNTLATQKTLAQGNTSLLSVPELSSEQILEQDRKDSRARH